MFGGPTSEERQPLNGNGTGFYFLPNRTPTSGANVEEADENESLSVQSAAARSPEEGGGGLLGGFAARVGRIFGGGAARPAAQERAAPHMKPRKVPTKVEPKVFFSNERTFLAWLHMSVTLASISIAIIAFADHNEWSQLYGLLLLPVAIAFSVYSLFIYQRRASMIRRRDPGPYEDRVGPILLSAVLMASIVLQFAVKLYHLSQ